MGRTGYVTANPDDGVAFGGVARYGSQLHHATCGRSEKKMSKREYDMMQVIKRHKIETAEALDVMLTTLNDMVSERDQLPNARMVAFGKARGISVGKAFAILVARGLDAIDAEQPSAPASDTTDHG